ncbi:unnamed protein product [Prorocentrum cordatum]|nr:unnamed protein product [Polarella glacialis]
MSLNPVNKGGSTVKGNKPFTEMGGDELQDHFHPQKRERMYAPKVVVKEYEVQTTTGDLLLRYNPAMKAIMIAKVDIEGHEGHFLKGASLLFSKFPPCVMTIELIPEWLERAGTPAKEVIDMLAGWGYKDVPSVAQFKKLGTRTIMQTDMTTCVERVRGPWEGREGVVMTVGSAAVTVRLDRLAVPKGKIVPVFLDDLAGSWEALD